MELGLVGCDPQRPVELIEVDLFAPIVGAEVDQLPGDIAELFGVGHWVGIEVDIVGDGGMD